MTTLVAGVIVAGIGGNANPHELGQHTNAAIASPADGDIIRYSTTAGKWTKSNPANLPVPSHDHSGQYVEPHQLNGYAPIITPEFQTAISVNGGTPTVIYREADHPYTTWINSTRIDAGAYFLKINNMDVLKIEAQYVSYFGTSVGVPFRFVQNNYTANNPGHTFFVDASSGNVTLTLSQVGDYHRVVNQKTGVILTFVREDTTPNTVTVAAHTGNSIDGQPSITLNGYKAVLMIQATDNGWRSIINNSAAQTNDTGWQDMRWYNTRLNDSRTGNWALPGMTKFMARKVNGFVYLRGGMTLSSAMDSYQNLCQLPSGMEPTVPSVLSPTRSVLGTATGLHTFLARTDGYIYVPAPTSITSGAVLYLDGIVFPTG